MPDRPDSAQEQEQLYFKKIEEWYTSTPTSSIPSLAEKEPVSTDPDANITYSTNDLCDEITTYTLHESASFKDALVSQPVVAPVKKKRKFSPKAATMTAQPTSPIIAPPKLQFYKDTSEEKMGENKTEENKTEDSEKNEEETKEDCSSITEEIIPMEVTEEGGHTPPNEEIIANQSPKDESEFYETKRANYELLRTNIRSILNYISEDKIKDVIKAIQEAGAVSVEDLKYLEEKDLKEILKPVPTKKLLQAWKEQGYCASSQSQLYSGFSGYGSYSGSAPSGYGSQPPSRIGSAAARTTAYGARASPSASASAIPPRRHGMAPPPGGYVGPVPPGGPRPMRYGGRGGFQGSNSDCPREPVGEKDDDDDEIVYIGAFQSPK